MYACGCMSIYFFLAIALAEYLFFILSKKMCVYGVNHVYAGYKTNNGHK